MTRPRNPGRTAAQVKPASGPTKATLAALEKVFAAEIEGLLPFQSKANIYRDLLAAGLVSWMERKSGSGWSAVVFSGYELTHRGRFLYCASCDDAKEPHPAALAPPATPDAPASGERT